MVTEQVLFEKSKIMIVHSEGRLTKPLPGTFSLIGMFMEGFAPGMSVIKDAGDWDGKLPVEVAEDLNNLV